MILLHLHVNAAQGLTPLPQTSNVFHLESIIIRYSMFKASLSSWSAHSPGRVLSYFVLGFCPSALHTVGLQ